MEIFKNVKRTQTLNTQGCCFLCLDFKEKDKTKQSNGDNVRQSIQLLLRHLQITAQSVNANSSGIFNGDCIKADFCESCTKVISTFSVLFHRLEKLQMEMNFLLKGIHRCISQSANNSKLVQNYSKRMTSDSEALAQLAFVDNLRKQLAKKSLNKQGNFPQMQVILSRTNLKLEKTILVKDAIEEHTNIVKFEDDEDQLIFSGDQDSFLQDSPSESPPLSPASSKQPEVDVNFPSGTHLQGQTEAISTTLETTDKNKTMQSSSKCFTGNKSTGVYKCRSCDKISGHYITIVDHFKAVHLKQRYKCDLCGISVFSHPSSLLNHKKICRETLQMRLSKINERESFKFVCNECGNKFSKKELLSKHRRIVHPNNAEFLCDRCNKRFKGSSHLQQHKQFVHFGKKVHCKFCKKMFSSRGSHYLHEKLCAKVMLKSEKK